MKHLIRQAEGKYSKVYHVKGMDFRYNYDYNCIECLFDGEVIDSIECFREDWEESPETMCEYFADDLNAEFENFYQFELKDMLDMK